MLPQTTGKHGTSPRPQGASEKLVRSSPGPYSIALPRKRTGFLSPRGPVSLKWQIILGVALLAGVIVFFELTDADIAVQDRLYRWDARQWRVDKDATVPRLLFYTGPKGLIIAFGVLCFVGLVLSFRVGRLRRHRLFCARVSAALAAVPLMIAAMKHLTNTYTPESISRYGGSAPYVKVLETYPPDFQQTTRAKGWPAGHCTGGFALMMLYFAFARRRNKVLGLLLGLAVGWTMGLYQVFKGAHYLSHTVVTVLIAWILILAIVRITEVPRLRALW